MNKVKILIAEDELVIALNIVDILEELGYEVLQPVTSYDEAIKSITEHDPDLALLDIQLKGEKTGIDIAHYLNKEHQIPFIFLTSNSDSATLQSAKKTLPASYLVKPFNQDDLFTSIEIAVYNYRQENKTRDEKAGASLIKDSIFIKNKNMFYKVKFEDILYFKSDHVYVEVHTVEDKKYVMRETISNLINELPQPFFRIHRSYIINLDFLEAINSVFVHLKGIQIPVGKSYRQELMDIINIK